MNLSDFRFARRLTDGEGWGFLPKDFGRLLSLTPGGSLVAEMDGKRAGMLTTLCTPRRCWIGNVVVSPDHQGRGIGRQLVLRALTFAESRGRGTVGLLSLASAVGFYERLGFLTGRRRTGFGGRVRHAGPLPPSGRIVPMDGALLPRVAALDALATGDDRSSLLGRLLRDFGKWSLVCLEGRTVQGYIIGKPGTTGMDIGPWLARKGQHRAAEALFLRLVSGWARPVEVAVPSQNAWARSFLEGLGLEKTQSYVEMHRGPPLPKSGTVEALAMAGLEKG